MVSDANQTTLGSPVHQGQQFALCNGKYYLTQFGNQVIATDLKLRELGIPPHLTCGQAAYRRNFLLNLRRISREMC